MYKILILINNGQKLRNWWISQYKTQEDPMFQNKLANGVFFAAISSAVTVGTVYAYKGGKKLWSKIRSKKQNGTGSQA
jgi:hypothetical protein